MPRKRSDAARYQHRKEAGLCIRCGAGLTEDDGAECVECTALYREYSKRYRSSERGKEQHRKRMAKDRARRQLLGQCRLCSLPAVAGRTMCEAHARRHAINVQRSRERAAERRAS